MKRCDVCGNSTFRRESVEETFHIEGHLVLVEKIPAQVCGRCGEATFDRRTAEKIRRMVHDKKRPTRTVKVEVFAYA